MVKLEVIEMSEPCCVALDALKSYAAVSDAGQEYLLMIALRRAFSEVQRYADVALLSGRFRVKADDHPGLVRVYMGGVVDSVTDCRGLPVPFRQEGSNVHVDPRGYVEVAFTTTRNEAEYHRLMPVVLQYATAVYDGKDGRELNSILKTAL